MGRITNAGIVMIIVNLGFVAAGVFLIRFTTELKSTGWLDALKESEYESAAGLLITAVMVLGILAIALAVIGIIGALTRNRTLLLFYAFKMVAIMIVFGVIGGTAFSFRGQMAGWQEKAFPADESEQNFAPTFNQIYCYAQGAFFCNSATTTDLLSIFLPGVPAELASLLPTVQGLNSLCNSSSISLIPNAAAVCKACDLAEKFLKFEKVLAWADEKCPRTATTSLWCASFLKSGTPGEVFVNSPYSACRTPFLTVAVDWATSLMTMGGAAFLAAALLLALSCFARRTRETSNDDDDDVVIMDNQYNKQQKSTKYNNDYDNHYGNQHNTQQANQYGNQHSAQQASQYGNQHGTQQANQYSGGQYDNHQYDNQHGKQYGNQYENQYDSHQQSSQYHSQYDNQQQSSQQSSQQTRQQSNQYGGQHNKPYAKKYNKPYEM